MSLLAEPWRSRGPRRPQERPDARYEGRPRRGVGQRAVTLFLVVFVFDLCRLTTMLAPGSRNERQRKRSITSS